MKRMKQYLSMAALALVGALMTGCSSEDDLAGNQQPENKNNLVTLTTTIGLDDGGTTRALTATGVKTFAAGDQIAVIYTKNGGTVTKAVSEALPAGSYGANATFTVTLDNPDKSQDVTYIYPAAMAGSTGVDYTKLNTQSSGTLTDLGSKYDLATNSGAWNAGALPSLTLANQLAILAITLKDNAATPAEITNTITGMTISIGAYNYSVTRDAASGPIYVAIRPTSDATIDVTATDGSKNYTKSLTNKTYEVSKGYNVSWRMTEVPNVPTGAISGKFSVSATKQVYFSKGNLQAKIASHASNSATASEWKFADSQYSTIGNAAGNTTFAAYSWVDLFSWVGNSATNDTYGLITFTYSSQANHGYVSGESLKTDWGTAAASSIGTGWRTLSKDEWVYLFNTRTVNKGTGSDKSYTLGQKVNDVSGVVLYPDDYTGAVYSGSDWANFESAGCVFLPAAGYRNGTSVNNFGLKGYYWSSTAYGTDRAYYVDFGSGNVTPASGLYRYRGFSVRLVREVPSN